MGASLRRGVITPARPPLCLGLDGGERAANGGFPTWCDERAPSPAESPQVGPELAAVLELGPRLRPAQVKPLEDVRDGAADEPEVDPLGRLETDGLERRRHQRAQGREVLRQNHVRAPFQNAQLALEPVRRPAQIRRRDHLEDELTRRRDLPREWTERSHRPAQAELDRERAAHEEGVEADPHPPECGERDTSSPGHEPPSGARRRVTTGGRGLTATGPQPDSALALVAFDAVDNRPHRRRCRGGLFDRPERSQLLERAREGIEHSPAVLTAREVAYDP